MFRTRSESDRRACCRSFTRIAGPGIRAAAHSVPYSIRSLPERQARPVPRASWANRGQKAGPGSACPAQLCKTTVSRLRELVGLFVVGESDGVLRSRAGAAAVVHARRLASGAGGLASRA